MIKKSSPAPPSEMSRTPTTGRKGRKGVLCELLELQHAAFEFEAPARVDDADEVDISDRQIDRSGVADLSSAYG